VIDLKPKYTSYILFADIDGCFNNAETGSEKVIGGRQAYPVSISIPLLRAIDKDTSITPVWMTHWGKDATAWNRYSCTKSWPVAYPLSPEKEKRAQKRYPELTDKCLAIAMYLENHLYAKPVFFQDGFPTVNPDWIKENDILLIDTTIEPLRTVLNAKQSNYTQSLQYILDLIKGVETQVTQVTQDKKDKSA
jgi:hypothetical protein